MAKILVTGGAGFIGSHVADGFLRAGHEVVVVDDLSSGKRQNVSGGVRFYREDVTDREAMARIFQSEKPDIIDHHAAQINLRRSVEDPLMDARQNILGSLVLLDLAQRYGVERFIFASTGGAIYGEPALLPVDEREEARPLSPYGVAKRSVELYLECYRANWGLDAVILRYGNVYGPRQDARGEAGVVAIFCTQLLSDQPCTIFGDGRQTRDYVFVEDVTRANVLALDGAAGVYNIGTGQETSVLDLVELLDRSAGRRVETIHADPRPGEVNRIALDCRKVQDALRWRPEVSIEQGVDRTFRWFSQTRQE